MSNSLQRKTLLGGGKLLGLILCLLVVLFSCENRSVQLSTLKVIVNDTLSGLSKTIQPDESVLGDSKGIDAYRIVVSPNNGNTSIADTGVVSKGGDMLLVSVAPGDYTFTVSGYINGHLVAETDNDITISGSETSVTLALKDIAKGNAGDLTLVVYLPYDCSGFDASSTITVTFTDGAVYTTTFGELSGHITEGSDDSGDYIEVVIPSGEALWTTGGVTSALPAGVGEMVLSLSYDGEIAESRAYCTLWDGVGLTGKVDMKRGEVSFFQWCFLDLPESLEYDQIGYGNGCFLLTEKHNSDNELSYVYSYAMRSVDSGWKIKEFDYYISDITFFKNQFVCVNMGAYSGSVVYFDGYLYGDNASSTFGMSSVLVSPSDISQYTAKAGDPDATVSLYRSADGLSWERLYITPSHMDDPFHPLIAGNSIVFFRIGIHEIRHPLLIYIFIHIAMIFSMKV